MVDVVLGVHQSITRACCLEFVVVDRIPEVVDVEFDEDCGSAMFYQIKIDFIHLLYARNLRECDIPCTTFRN